MVAGCAHSQPVVSDGRRDQEFHIQTALGWSIQLLSEGTSQAAVGLGCFLLLVF